MTAEENFVESLREVLQDLLVPELKSVQVSLDALRTEMTMNTSALREEMKLHRDALREELRLRDDHLVHIVHAGDERNAQLIRGLAEKLDLSVEVRERLANLEARLPRQ